MDRRKVQVGDICATPFLPRGKVKVLEIESFDERIGDETCWIEYIEDHPHGYKQGANGRYKRSELILLTPKEGQRMIWLDCPHCGEPVPIQLTIGKVINPQAAIIAANDAYIKSQGKE